MARTTARAQRGRRRELADWVAELCIDTGLTLAQAREHSLAQLRLLADAKGRLQARDALVTSQAVFAAVAAAMHQDNQRILGRLQDRLLEQANGD